MIALLITLCLFSLIVWVLVTYVAKTEPFRTLVIAIAAIFAILYIMGALGIVDMPMPRLR